MTLFLTTAYLAPVEYYILSVQAGRVIIESNDNYVKQTYRNRCVIACANGLQTLTIPVVNTAAKCLMRDIRIADHGNWQHLHWNAIVSAYKSTPFFEYYADEFFLFYKKRQHFLFDFNEQLREWLCSQLDISFAVSYTTGYTAGPESGIWDLREAIHPKKKTVTEKFKPYYQVFENRYGFQSNLSIIDLLFNMGPESFLWLS
ncbi:MAG: WbqC family protein [Dysgonamonadaceae bacterium]|jgi:hypothetical protein|nr:WbqC family protein [Dysgonamonadaceae bacterium]